MVDIHVANSYYTCVVVEGDGLEQNPSRNGLLDEGQKDDVCH